MKKKLSALLSALLLTAGFSIHVRSEERTFVTSFYPMYIFTLNVTAGVPDIQVLNMVENNTGCLHDYQLQTRDMMAIEQAEALIINGGGMEQFVDKIADQQAQLTIINASLGIEMLSEEDHLHEHENGVDHEDEVFNAHVWLDPQLAVQQVQNIANGLITVDPENAEAYQRNAENYILKIQTLDEELRTQMACISGKQIVTFHEAFTYFADAYHLHVAGTIGSDSGEEPSTRKIAQTCDLIRSEEIRALFIEPQYLGKSAQTIARETGASIYVLDPIVTGDGSLQSYENAMRENARVLIDALAEK